jgi:hypothetical protein
MFKTTVLTAFSLMLLVGQTLPAFAGWEFVGSADGSEPSFTMDEDRAEPETEKVKDTAKTPSKFAEVDSLGRISFGQPPKPISVSARQTPPTIVKADDPGLRWSKIEKTTSVNPVKSKKVAASSSDKKLLAKASTPKKSLLADASDDNDSLKSLRSEKIVGGKSEDSDSSWKRSASNKSLLAKSGDDDALVSGEKPEFGGGSDKGVAAKCTSFLTGTIFGTPVAMVRAAGVDWKRGTSELSGESKNPLVLGVIGTALLPFVAVGGLVAGPMYGIQNAYKKEPFSKDSFSLGEDFQ